MGTTNLDALSLSGALAVTGAVTPAGGIGNLSAALTQPSVNATGGMPPATATTGTDTTPSVTETYVCRVFVPANVTLTGLSLLNGSAAAGNVKAGLFTTNGVLVAQSASTAQSGTAAYQDFAFTSTYAAVGPGLYLAAFQFDSTSARFRTHAVGRFTAFKKTGETYGTFTTLTNPNTFTAGQGPIASTY